MTEDVAREMPHILVGTLCCAPTLCTSTLHHAACLDNWRRGTHAALLASLQYVSALGQPASQPKELQQFKPVANQHEPFTLQDDVSITLVDGLDSLLNSFHA